MGFKVSIFRDKSVAKEVGEHILISLTGLEATAKMAKIAKPVKAGQAQ